MFQVLDTASKSDSDACEAREEEYVDVEDMTHRNNQRVRRRSEERTGGESTESDAHGGTWRKRAKEEPDRSPKTKQRGEGRTSAEAVHGPSHWSGRGEFLCRPPLGRPTARPVRRSQGHPQLATSRLMPVKGGRRLSREPSGHAESRSERWR